MTYWFDRAAKIVRPSCDTDPLLLSRALQPRPAQGLPSGTGCPLLPRLHAQQAKSDCAV